MECIININKYITFLSYKMKLIQKEIAKLQDNWSKIVVFYWVLCRTNTVKVKWRLSSFTGGGILQVPPSALFQAQVGTRVEPLTFCKLAG